MADAGNSINFMALMNPEFAARQQSLARQQAIAQAIMDEGKTPDDINKLANPGGFVVPYSPLQGLAKAGDKIAGSYMQKQVDEEQLESYKQLAAQMQGQPSPTSNQPTNSNAQALGGAMSGDLSRTLSDPRFIMASMMSPEAAGKALVDPMMATSEMKNNQWAGISPQETGEQMRAKALKEGLIPGGQDYINMPGSHAADVLPQPQSGPPAPAMVNGQPQAPANMDELLNQYSATPNVMPNPIPGTTPGYDPNSSAAVTEAKAAAQKRGEGSITDVQQQDLGRQQVSSVIGDIGKYYDDLNRVGGTVNPENNAIENAAAYTGNSLVGQEFGKIAGTKNQSMRNKIEQSRPLLINAIRKATGMSAKAMDSNTELQFYLKAATDPTLDVKANKAALKNLEEIYGLGANGGQKPASSVTHTYIPGKGIMPVGGD